MKTSSLIAGTLAVASQLFAVSALSHTRVHVLPAKVERAPKSLQSPALTPQEGAITSVGCYTSNANMTETAVKAGLRVSSGNCREVCLQKDYTLLSVQGTSCFCGMAMPPSDDKTSDSKCNYPCPGFGDEACGSIGEEKHYSVFNLGVNVDPPTYKPKEKPTSTKESAPESTKASDPEKTAVESDAPAATTSSSSSDDSKDKSSKDKSSPNTAGIVAGSVVGVVAVAAGFGGLWFFMRRRRNTEIEEEHRRNAAVNAFISGSKPPGSSGSISMTDSRLDPVMAHRRLSDGSIEDNQDYSRKILRVTNA